jgi:hypothetical protein
MGEAVCSVYLSQSSHIPQGGLQHSITTRIMGKGFASLGRVPDTQQGRPRPVCSSQETGTGFAIITLRHDGCTLEIRLASADAMV